jgi:DNA repair exonuclease SbcCD nuclease subunit
MRSPVLVVSDIHFHAFKQHSKLIDGVNSRLLDQIRAWRQAVELGQARGCSLMLIAGDVFEVRGSIKPSVFNRVTSLVMETLARGFDIGVVPGNHDMESFGAGESATDSWDYLKDSLSSRRCKVFKAPELVRMGGYKILGIPYCHDVKDFKETFGRLGRTLSPDITVIHQGLDNFNTDSSYPATGITAEWLEENNPGVILSGHYHNPGRSVGGRVINVGGLVQHRFSDEGRARGCWIISENSFEFITLDSPRFITIDASQTRRRLDDLYGNFVRIRAGKPGEAEDLRRRVEAAGALSVVVEIEREFKSAHERTVSLGAPREMLSEYLDIADRYKNRKDAILSLFDRICA